MEYKGNPVSNGIAIGQVFKYAPVIPIVEENFIDTNETNEACEKYLEARKKASFELDAIAEALNINNPEKAKIFHAHLEMLLDTAVNDEILDSIRDKYYSPDWAVQKIYDKYCRIFSKSKDATIQDRVADLKDIRIRLHRKLFDLPAMDLSSLEKPVVVVAHDLLPSDTVTIDRKNVLAIVTEIGGATSHSAIIARSYGIPAILGIMDILDELKTDETIVVDAIEGLLITQVDDRQLADYIKKRADYLTSSEELKKYLGVESFTKDGTYIEVYLNIGSAEADELAGSKFADGVGLFRTEYVYMTGNKLPSEEEQFKQYRKVALEFGERPVYLRTLDIGGDKQVECLNLPKETNPFLGLRALRLCFDNIPLFKTQLRAVFKASHFGNICIMLPMVGSIDDIRAAKSIVNQVKAELGDEGIKYNADTKIGIMIEIPSIALIADHVAKEVDFASFGTNDLCQYLTATDRLNPGVAHYYQSYHPSMFKLISQSINAFNAAGKPISICGEMGGDPLSAAVLIGLGIRRLSMELASIPAVKKMITKLTISKAEELAQNVLTFSSASDVESYLKDELMKTEE